MTEDEWAAVLTDDHAPTASRRLVIEAMRAALRGGDPAACTPAISVVARVGMAAADLRGELVRLWQSPGRAGLTRPLADALARVRELPTLVEALRAGGSARLLRRVVPAALRGLGPAAAAAAPALVETLRDDDKRQEAVYALEAMGAAAVPALVAGLADASGLLRARALRVLGRLGPPARAALRAALPAALDALDAPEGRVRAEALFALGRMPPLPEAALAGLIRSLADGEPSVRQAAAAALRGLGPDAAAATPALVSLLAAGGAAGAPSPRPDDADDEDDEDDEERVDLLGVLGAIGGAAAGAAGPTVRAILADPEAATEVRAAAALAVWRVCGDAAAAAAALRELADPGTPHPLRARLEAANAPQVVLDQVERTAANRRRAAGRALYGMGAAAGDCTDALVRGLTGPDTELRADAVRAAPHLVADRAVVTPLLLSLLGVPDGDSRWGAVQSLLRMGVTDPRVGASVRLAMERGAWDLGPCSWDTGRCQEAVTLIRTLGPAAVALVPTLEHLRDRHPAVRPDAVFALARVRGDAAAAVPDLIPLLADADPGGHRQAVARCLGEIGPAARDAVPHLVRLARHDGNRYTRTAALRALERIEPGAAARVRESCS